MEQKRIGRLLKELRKEKGITQEQFAEKFNVSSRTVSRWENGNNMPDLDILIEISDYYGIDLREIFKGERKSDTMDKETKETVLESVDYANMIAKKNYNKVRIIIGGVILLLVYYCLALGDGGENVLITNEVLHEFGMIAPAFAIILLLIVELLVIRNGLIIDAYHKRVEDKKNRQNN